VKRFYICENNGVTALVSEEVFQRILNWKEKALEAVEKDVDYPVPYPGPIFTFSDLPGLAAVVTGDRLILEEFTENFELQEAKFKVPFSNCGGDIRAYRHEELLTELETRPTMRQIIDTFGLICLFKFHSGRDTRIPVSSV